MLRRDALRLLVASALNGRLAHGQDPGRPLRKQGRGVLARFDEIVEEILQEHRIAGASLAIAKDGRLVLARGYGLADVNTRKPVTPETLFSTASVSKPITAVAILKLVEEGKLRLEAHLVDLFIDLQPLEGKRPADPRFRDINVYQMLYHGSGIARDIRKPQHESKVKDQARDDDDEATDDIIAVYRTALSRPLQFAPGSDHRYSNAAFVILQLVIERASGQPYEAFVREQILRPLGITRMVMETNAYIPEETRRYTNGPDGLRPVVGHRASNWLATPTDLIRFLTSVDGSRGRPILSPRMRGLMLAIPPAPIKPNAQGRHVGLGWDAVQSTGGGFRYSKNGGKAGVRAWLEHIPRRIDWAFQFNTGEQANPDGKNPAALTEAARRISEAAESLKQWPEIDLFGRT
jgi:CubicO group peptidase (beta-lactamase class C family)